MVQGGVQAVTARRRAAVNYARDVWGATDEAVHRTGLR